MEITRLSLPLVDEQIQGLRLGDTVSMDGVIFTCRTLFHIRVLERGVVPPIDFDRVNIMCHMGPVMRPDGEREDGWEPLCIGGTASMRFEKYTAGIIEKLGLKAIVGKGTIGPKTMDAMRRFDCVHLCSVGLYSKVLGTRVKRVLDVYGLQEMGMIEATWVLEVEDFGPFIVAIDSEGDNLFHRVNRDVANRAEEVCRHFGLPQPSEASWYR
jgi:tartrate/fumarate subfamily iron-sulfur-dependent hydro-lyase beta chain